MFHIPRFYTVESVTNGHPDKVCDQISDAVLDACLKDDPKSRVAVESFGGHGLIVVGGEVTTKADPDFARIAENVYRRIGYTEPVEVKTNIAKQSPDIAQGVDTGGAGDQGIMYGYASNETAEYLPLGVVLVHKLTEGLEKLRTSGELPWLRPDGKAQITMNNNRIKNILISTQHDENVTQTEIRSALIDKLIKQLIPNLDDIEVLVNPTGKFAMGGFEADTGLTGRKIMVDTYCGLVPHGGGAFSGKDPSKVDRSAAYMARFAAKNIVAAGLADKCLVSVAYAIGRAEPLMVEALNEKGESIADAIAGKFDFRPRAIIERLDLLRPLYQRTASYGHFGKDGLPWEEIVGI